MRQKKEATEKVAGLPKPMAPDPMKQASASGELRVVEGQTRAAAVRSIYSVPCRRTLC